MTQTYDVLLSLYGYKRLTVEAEDIEEAEALVMRNSVRKDIPADLRVEEITEL